jgi:feruloyl esterase
MDRRKTAFATILLASAVTSHSSVPPLHAQGMSDPSERCEKLAGQVMGEVKILASAYYAEGRTLLADQGGFETQLPPHCELEGVINERVGVEGKPYGIGFKLALPSDWNGRYLLMGGGGLNGSIRPPTGPVAAGTMDALSRGFAVASHDSGHKGAGFDRSFMADQRAALDFAESSVRTVTLATRDLVQGFYGEAPHHSYMTGCSTGGREGMLASQRYPELFDGIVVGAPAMRPGHSNLSIEYAQVVLNRTLDTEPAQAAGFSPAERSAILSEVLNQCDAQDGIEDGMIMNVSACRSFDSSALQCAAGQDGGCLNADRVEALELAFAGPHDASGRPIYVSMPWDTGIVYQGPGLPGYLPAGQPGPFGPANASREIDIDERMNDVRMDAVGRLTDTAYWTNLSTYLERGSKIMFFHGVSDPWFSAFDTWDYFERAKETNGAQAWEGAARFYMVPGMMHCSGGNAFGQFDLLGPMVEWVEAGKEPAGIVANRASGKEGEMPLCPHPSYPRYAGGNPALSASYQCTAPHG